MSSKNLICLLSIFPWALTFVYSSDTNPFADFSENLGLEIERMIEMQHFQDGRNRLNGLLRSFKGPNLETETVVVKKFLEGVNESESEFVSRIFRSTEEYLSSGAVSEAMELLESIVIEQLSGENQQSLSTFIELAKRRSEDRDYWLLRSTLGIELSFSTGLKLFCGKSPSQAGVVDFLVQPIVGIRGVKRKHDADISELNLKVEFLINNQRTLEENIFLRLSETDKWVSGSVKPEVAYETRFALRGTQFEYEKSIPHIQIFVYHGSSELYHGALPVSLDTIFIRDIQKIKKSLSMWVSLEEDLILAQNSYEWTYQWDPASQSYIKNNRIYVGESDEKRIQGEIDRLKNEIEKMAFVR